MVTIMERVNVVPATFKFKSSYLVITSLLLSSWQLQAETTFEPLIDASTYAFWKREQQNGDALDRGVAFMLSPGLKYTSTSKHVSSSLFWQKEAIWYEDSQRDHKSYDKFRARNVITGFDRQVSLGFTAASGYTVRNSQQGVFSDYITGDDNLSKTSTVGGFLNMANDRSANTRASLNVAYNKINSNKPELDDGFGNFDNDTTTAALSFGNFQSAQPFFYQLNGDYSNTSRESRDDFVSEKANALLGMPLFSRLSLITRATYESHNSSALYTNEFTSYGAGLLLRFGKVSWINVTANRSEMSNSALDGFERENDYLAAELYFAPSRRTSLSASIDRRYFGRTASVSGQYNMRFITVRLSYSDTVQTLARLDVEFNDLGVFVCPDGSTDLSDCFKPPTNNYIPRAGESYFEAREGNLEISEELVLRRSAGLSVAYSKNRLSLSMSLDSSEDEYVESNRLTRRNMFAVQSTWRLSEKLSWQANARYYQLDYASADREDNNLLVETGFKHSLSDKNNLTLMARRTARNSNMEELDSSEKRVWLMYQHKF